MFQTCQKGMVDYYTHRNSMRLNLSHWSMDSHARQTWVSFSPLPPIKKATRWVTFFIGGERRLITFSPTPVCSASDRRGFFGPDHVDCGHSVYRCSHNNHHNNSHHDTHAGYAFDASCDVSCGDVACRGDNGGHCSSAAWRNAGRCNHHHRDFHDDHLNVPGPMNWQSTGEHQPVE